MDIQDAQREVRSVYVGGFWGQLVSSVIWLASAALGTWVSPKASILYLICGAGRELREVGLKGECGEVAQATFPERGEKVII
jgi:hypothetical protein